MTTTAVPIILIHGAWQGSWTFGRLLPELADRGVTAVAIDLPGNGTDDTSPGDVTLELYCDVIEALIDELGGEAILVGHSGAGIIATAAAEQFPDKVDGVVYLAGMCLPQGIDFGELTELVAGPGNVFGISGDITVSDDGQTSMVPFEEAARYFLNDVPYDEAIEIVQQLTPQPTGGQFISSPTTADRFGTIPTLYIEALKDLSMILEAQRVMQQFIPDMPVVSLDTGHVPQFTDPAGVADALVDFVESLSIRGS